MSFTYTIGSPSNLTRTLAARKKRQRKNVMASLMLTPMVDMFSLLVIFLLQFFNASPDFQLTKEMVLPSSVSSTEPKDIPVVSVTASEILVDHKSIGSVDDIIKNPEPLAVALQKVRDAWVAAHTASEFKGEINLEAHEDLESTKVSQLMAVLSAQQYGSIQLMTLGN